jgi:hypothetical protein
MKTASKLREAATEFGSRGSGVRFERGPASFLSALLVAAGLLCGAPASAIQQEQAGQVEIFAKRYTQNANQTFHSYTAASWGGCSGAMVGPNLFMTAAHCGFYKDIGLNFRTYRAQSPTAIDHTAVQCKGLWQNLHPNPGGSQLDITDMALYWCDDVSLPNGTKLPPGELFGYLDFDTRASFVGIPTWYSPWWNPVVSPSNLSWTLLWSQGKDMRLQNTAIWPARLELRDMWANGGGSGSPVISSDNNRVFAVTSSGASDAPWRGFYLSMGNSIATGEVAPNTPAVTSIQNGNIAALGLNPANYVGKFDKDGDKVIDIQEDLEALHFAPMLDHHWLGFESRRRNALWDLSPAATINPDQWTPPGPAFGRLTYNGMPTVNAGVTFASTRQLTLEPNTRYRVKLIYTVLATQGGDGLGFAVVDGSSSIPVRRLSTAAVGGYTHAAFEIVTGPEPLGIALSAWRPFRFDLYYVSMIKEGSLLDLDTDSKRQGFRDANTGGRALILPDGTGVGSDWALAVRRTGAGPFSVRNEHVGFVAGESYSVCFSYRLAPGKVQPASGLTVAVVDGASNAVQATVTKTATTTWQSACLGSSFVAKPKSELRMQAQSDAAIILVDDIQVTRNSATADSCQLACGGASQGCYCDSACTQHGDCCADYTGFCVDNTPSAWTCLNRCGQAFTGQCFCDAACVNFGDCCEDYLPLCE